VIKQRVRIGGILHKRDLAKIGVKSIPDRPGVASAVFGALGAAGVNCTFIVHTIVRGNLDEIVLCVAQGQLATALAVLEELRIQAEEMEVTYDREVGTVSIFGPHFGDRPGIAGAMFSVLARAGINILAISTSISSVSCVLGAGDMDEAIRALEEAFESP
jgi:aspartokinase